MARPRHRHHTLAERLARLKAAGLSPSPPPDPAEALPSLDERVRAMLGIVQTEAVKATHMIYLVMYDISDHKVRREIARYLERRGCVRIQKSVFMARTENKHFQEIHDTLKEVNSYYENQDSILLVPINTSDARAMKVIGKALQIDLLTNPPNTLFF